nr:hypothetical protein CFP56_31569 [Quercus suber]
MLDDEIQSNSSGDQWKHSADRSFRGPLVPCAEHWHTCCVCAGSADARVVAAKRTLMNKPRHSRRGKTRITVLRYGAA